METNQIRKSRRLSTKSTVDSPLLSHRNAKRNIKRVSYAELTVDEIDLLESPKKSKSTYISKQRASKAQYYVEHSDLSDSSSEILSNDYKLNKENVISGETTPIKKYSNQSQTPRTRKNIEDISSSLTEFQITTPKQKLNKQIEKLQNDTPTRSILKSSNKKKSIKRVSLALEFLRRDDDIVSDQTNLEKARKKLHVSAVPTSLPCRENEYSDVYNFLYGKLSSNSSGCMYVAGVPGTGKTATVTEVIKNLKEIAALGDDDIPLFDFVNINGMRLTEPRQVYVQILNQLTGKTYVWDQAYELLKQKILKNSSKKNPIILLVDELDVMYTKRQDVVYNILDWPTKINSKLIIIAISNTMDLPERLLMGRVASRLGLTRLPFQPYTFKQLEKIVVSRLQGTNTFQDEAVQLVARKVAAVSGDARRALDICRRAAEIVALTEEAGMKVSLRHVNKALNEMINSDQILLIQSLTTVEKLFLQAILAEITRTGVEETSYQNVLKQFKTLCVIEAIPEPSYSNLNRTAQYLAKQKIIILEKSKFYTINQLYLNLSQDDLHFALNQIN